MSSSEHRERPSVTVDVVVVARYLDQQQVLLIKRKNPPFRGYWALPGGFVESGETLEEAAFRELREETGMVPDHLEQLHAFGDPGRDPRGWTISVAHLAVVEKDELHDSSAEAGTDASEAGWFALSDPPPLAFDHADILAYAARRLAAEIVNG